MWSYFSPAGAPNTICLVGRNPLSTSGRNVITSGEKKINREARLLKRLAGGFSVLQESGEMFFVFLCYDTHKDVKVLLVPPLLTLRPYTILKENGDYCRKKSVVLDFGQHGAT